MNWTKKQIHFIIEDLIEENPLACRALFQLSSIEFSDKVDTMAVSLSAAPVLLINLDFCRKHLQHEQDVKAVLLHEFLHVLLLHTEKYKCNSPLLNICLDAIINAIIFRTQGLEYAAFFARFYQWEKLSFLLRPQCGEEPLEKEWMDLHKRIYEGKYGADELHELLDYLRSKQLVGEYDEVVLLGNHANKETPVSKEVSELLEKTMAKMNGVKIWSKIKFPGNGNAPNKERHEIEKHQQQTWNTATLNTLKKCLLPTRHRQPELITGATSTLVLNGSDKRSLSKYLLTGLFSFSSSETMQRQLIPKEKVHIYLDVSGSMKNEIDRIVSLLYHFRGYIKNPLWVFSDAVKEAFFIRNQLEYDTSYGTRIEPVFEHMRINKITKALIVTDGYVDDISEEMLKGLDLSGIQVLLSEGGNSTQFENSKIAYTRLEPFIKTNDTK